MEMSRYARHNPLDAGYQSFAEIFDNQSQQSMLAKTRIIGFFFLFEQDSRQK
jgi:hypothetical protein